MPEFTEFCSELLQNSARLTSLRDEESLVAAFFALMMEQFEDLQSISLYKYERLYKDSSLTLEAFQNKQGTAGLACVTEEAEMSDEYALPPQVADELEQLVIKNIELEEYTRLICERRFLILRVNQDNQAVYFLAYEFSGVIGEELQSAVDQLKESLLPSIRLIRYLTAIYSNHQLLISLNDKDSLTGLYNRKFFDRKMNQLAQMNSHQHRRQEEDHKVSFLAILDIDHFKRVNDAFGHLYGDEVLLHFAQQMQKVFRDEDWLFRYGGEEFVVILKNIDETRVESILHRFREHIATYNFPKVDQVTISIGVTRLDSRRMQSEIIDRADNALYYVKEHGRNNVAYYEKLVSQGLLQEMVTKDDIELF